MLKDLIKDNTILIAPNNIKNKLLDSLNSDDKLYNIKIMSFEEIKRKIYFDYDTSTIIYLMNKYDYKYSVAKKYIDNLYYISENKNNHKIKRLIEIKEELISNNLLYFDKLFYQYIKNKNILVYGYDYINKFNRTLLNKFNNVEIIEKESFNYNPNVYHFNTLNEEVEYVFYSIATLIGKGVDINKIKLSGISDEYYYSIRKFSNYYNIPVNIDGYNIYSSNMVQSFLKKCKETNDFYISLDYVKNNYNLDNSNNSNIYSIIVNKLNNYDLTLSFDKIYECIINDFKNTKLNNNKFINAVEIIDIKDNYILDDYYIFLLGFNQNIIPKMYKDDDYITDNIKDTEILETTDEKNKIEKDIITKIIKSIKNLTITYKFNSIAQEYYPSDLIEELGFNNQQGYINELVSYSSSYDKLKCAITLDNLLKYGIKNDRLYLYNNNYDIPYLKYDNNYKKINPNKIIDKYRKKGLTLSYSSLDNYFHCAFKYYLNNILCINKYEEKFEQKIGTFFHYVLSICLEKDFDFETEYSNYVNKMELNYSDKFFINHLKKELNIIINAVIKLHNDTGLTNYLLEKDISIDKSSKIPVVLNGKIDKIMYKEKDGINYVSIIDYKTGDANIDLKMAEIGLNLQLPIYLYLVSKSNILKNIKFSGFYIQRILNSEVKLNDNKSYEDLKEQNLKLKGYTTDDINRLEMFDPTYEDSKYITGIKLTKDNELSKKSRTISDLEIDNLIDLVDIKINEARDNILSSNFDINPKEINGKLVGCNFCKYKDICYKTNSNIKRIYLGGADND